MPTTDEMTLDERRKYLRRMKLRYMAADRAERSRLDEMKQQLAAKGQELRGKQQEVDRLYGKLAAASPLTDAEMQRALAEALARLAGQKG